MRWTEHFFVLDFNLIYDLLSACLLTFLYS